MIKAFKYAIIMLLLSAVLLCASAYAQNGDITVSTSEITQGETTFDVKINVNNNPGITFAKFKVEFPQELALKNVTDGGIWGSNNHSNNLSSPYTLYWNNGTATSDFTSNGTVATLTFEVAETISVGTYPITVSVVQGSTFNYNDDDVIFNTNSGGIIVKQSSAAGDLVTVTFNAAGGTVSPKTKTVTVNSAYGTLPTPIRENYTFDGWYTTVSGGDKITESTVVRNEENHTLYARWYFNKYTVTFNANGGFNAPESQIKKHHQTLTLSSEIPVRDGYVFKGWAQDAKSNKAEFKPGCDFNVNKNVELYAVWVPDISRDESTNDNDVVIVAKSIIGSIALDSVQESAADIDGDGRVGIKDLIALVQRIHS